MKATISSLFALLLFSPLWSKSSKAIILEHMAPTHWYIGFQDPSVEIIIHAKEAGSFQFSLAPYAGASLIKSEAGTHPDIAYLTLQFSSETPAGWLQISGKNKQGQVMSIPFELKSRRSRAEQAPGLNQSDVQYLIFPDRFANGNPNNDHAPVRHAEKADRSALRARHGGDLEGIIQHLDYLQALGVTALWLNPVQESDQEGESFHGYGLTNHYRIDPRFGGDAAYAKLCQDMRQRGMKMVMDIIPNHPGSSHWMYENPDQGWFNFQDSFVQSNFRAHANHDPYADPSEKLLNNSGAFVRTMPDYNQNNPHIARYFKQLYLWWVEVANLSGYRIDTYPFVDQDYMNELCATLMEEYPNLSIYGETWVYNAAEQASYCQSRVQGYEKNTMPGVTDFALCWAMIEAANKPTNWHEGLSRVYMTLSQDFLYQQAHAHCTFVDNHDMARIWSVVHEDLDAWKRAMGLLLTSRGIPCVYYGTEILMPGAEGQGDAYYRFDFPGGWNSDSLNKFDAADRSPLEQEAFLWLQNLMRFRSQNSLFESGQFHQFSAKDNVYANAWTQSNRAMLNLFSGSPETHWVDFKRYQNICQGFNQWRNLQTGETGTLEQGLNLDAGKTVHLELLP